VSLQRLEFLFTLFHSDWQDVPAVADIVLNWRFQRMLQLLIAWLRPATVMGDEVIDLGCDLPFKISQSDQSTEKDRQ